MIISIYSSISSAIRINLLELASSILKKFKFWETYSIDMEFEFDNHFITDGGCIRDRYFISQEWYIIDHRYEYEITHEEDSAWVISEEEIKREARLYSDKEFMNIITWRIKRWLEKIWCINIQWTLSNNKIIVTFQLEFITKNDYRDFLIGTIRQRISDLNPTYTVDEIETGAWNQIHHLSNILKSKSLNISSKDFGTLLSYGNTWKTNEIKDCMDIFTISFPDNILTHILYIFLYQEKIWWHIIQNGIASKIELLSEINNTTETIMKEWIWFNKDNWQVTYNWEEIVTLKWTDKLFFWVLFEKCRDIRVKPEDICKAMKKDTVWSYNDYSGYLRKRKAKLPLQLRRWINNGIGGIILNDK